MLHYLPWSSWSHTSNILASFWKLGHSSRSKRPWTRPSKPRQCGRAMIPILLLLQISVVLPVHWSFEGSLQPSSLHPLLWYVVGWTTTLFVLQSCCRTSHVRFARLVPGRWCWQCDGWHCPPWTRSTWTLYLSFCCNSVVAALSGSMTTATSATFHNTVPCGETTYYTRQLQGWRESCPSSEHHAFRIQPHQWLNQQIGRIQQFSSMEGKMRILFMRQSLVCWPVGTFGSPLSGSVKIV